MWLRLLLTKITGHFILVETLSLTTEGIPTTHILDTWECTLTESKSLKN